MKVYAAREKDTGVVITNASGRFLYARKTDAKIIISQTQRHNKRRGITKEYEIVSSEIEWKVEE